MNVNLLFGDGLSVIGIILGYTPQTENFLLWLTINANYLNSQKIRVFLYLTICCLIAVFIDLPGAL